MKRVEALKWGQESLTGLQHSNPSQEATWLLDKSLGQVHETLNVSCTCPKDLSGEEWFRYRELVQKRVEGTPLAYLMRDVEFMGIVFKVDDRCLIPREETEILVRETLKLCKKIECPQILEIGTGSGALSVALAKNCASASILATDISKQALSIALENARLQKVESRIRFINGSLFEPISQSRNLFDIILSNPPYIKTGEIQNLQSEIQMEPKIALDGGENGLAIIQPLVENSRFYLKKQGHLLLEIGEDQAWEVQKIMENSGFINLEVIKDNAEKNRVIKGECIG